MTKTLSPETTQSSFSIRELPPARLGAALLGEEEVELVAETIRSQRLFRYAYDLPPAEQGRMTASLEAEVVKRTGVKYALGVTSGTAALEISLAALGVGPGDEVIIPAWSWVSCFTSVVRLGALPVMGEVDETLCLAPGEVTRLKTPRTKVVMVVHYQGVAADMDSILKEAKEAGLAVIEDCAEAPGATYRGTPVGSMGDIAIFSFQQQKCITSGEGGMVLTSESALYERAVRMHDLGFYRGHHAVHHTPQGSHFCGAQYRMNEVTAAVALGQYRKLPGLLDHCHRVSLPIQNAIREFSECELRKVPSQGEHGYETYFFVPTGELRDEFIREMSALNIQCTRMTGTYGHYARDYCRNASAYSEASSPFHQFKSWPAPGYREEDFPRTVDLSSRMISIPVGVLHSVEDGAYIGEAIRHVATTLGFTTR